MPKKYFALTVLLLVSALFFSLFGVDVKPNKVDLSGIEPAVILNLNEVVSAKLTPTDTLDLFQISVENTKMYTLNTLTDPVKFNAKNIIKMDVLDQSGKSVLTADPSSRYDAMGARLTGWVPQKTGTYYVKIWATSANIKTVADASYQMRFWYGTPVTTASTEHEPDNSATEASTWGDAPVDGTKIRGYLYNHFVQGDSIDTNWNDIDLYKITVPQAGMILIAETFTSAWLWDHGNWCRDLDTEIWLLDSNGAATPIVNDDKTSWAGDPWDNDNPLTPGVSNTYSRFVTPEIPAAGTYYVQVNAYYNSVVPGRNRNPKNTHRDPGGGEYLVSFRLLPANHPSFIAQDLALNTVKDGSISTTDTVDVWQIYAENTKMYTLNTLTDPVKFNAKNVLKMDVLGDDGKSVLKADPSSRYDAMGARLTGWVPNKTGLYYVKIWAKVADLAKLTDANYKMRFWYGTPLTTASTTHEPDNTAAEAAALGDTPVDGSKIRGYLYNHFVQGDTIDVNFNDIDLYKVTVPQAGMILTAETFTSAWLWDHGNWCRDLDTEIWLLDATGAATPITNDDKTSWAGDPWDNDNPLTPGVSNTYSKFVSPEIPAAGTYYVQVNSYYNSVVPGRNSNPQKAHRDPGGGEYLLALTLTWPKEMEPNNDMAGANLVTLQTVIDAALSPTDSVDYFAINVDADKMYTLNTICPRGVNAKSVLKMSVMDASGVNVLNSDPSSRYDGWGARLTGWVPPKSGTYYCKISAKVTAEYPYKIRLWYGTSLSTAKTTHEPDDFVADAAKWPALDLANPTKIHGYLYADFVDSLGNHYNWNDFDLYKIKLKAGDVLTAELFTAGPDSCIRDLDTEMVLLDSLGNATPIENDDKDAWEGDPWENYLTNISNTFSRFITPEVPAGGTYYLQVNSYYNSRNRKENPAKSHNNPGGGEYMLLAKVTNAVGVAQNSHQPLTYSLSQNYPNPFNPTTTISYSLPRAEKVTLTIYNMLGERVKELINSRQQAGSYNLTWDATDRNGVRMPSGVYFYRIEAGSFVKVNKMILLK